jgi:DNA-binding GntR family transcriptional regulator
MRASSAELLIELEGSRVRGFRAQVEDGLRDAIRSGRLAPGALLPSEPARAAGTKRYSIRKGLPCCPFPRYRQIASELRATIEAGRLSGGRAG